MSIKKYMFAICLLIAMFLVVGAGVEQEAKEYSFFADSEEQAKKIASLYNGNLSYYANGIGTISVSADKSLMMHGEEGADTQSIVLYPEYTYFIEPEEIMEGVEEQWHLETVEVEEAWKISKGRDVTVAIIDTGIDSDHEDLAAGIIQTYTTVPETQYGEKARFAESDKGIEDNLGHGTHVAGIIGARENEFGCVGIAPECNIISIKALERDGSKGVGKTSWVASGIRLAIESGADIINLSLGGSSVQDDMLYTVIKEAYDAGIVVVCAAGNISGTPVVYYPGAYEETIAVSALRKLGDSVTFASSFSNYGEWIDISAPGASVMSTVIDGYGLKSGTSMAAPMISGSVALLKERDSGLSVEEIKNLLYESACDFGQAGRDDKYGYGALNCKNLFECYEGEYVIPKPDVKIPDNSTIGEHTTILIDVPQGVDCVVYTFDDTEPDKDSLVYLSSGITLPENEESLTLKVRSVMSDKRLGKCLCFKYQIVKDEIVGEKEEQHRNDIIPKYGAFLDPVLSIPCRRYKVSMDAGEKIEVLIEGENFQPILGLYDGQDENGKLLADSIQEENNASMLDWINTTNEVKDVWISVATTEDIVDSDGMRYDISWKCAKTDTEEPSSSDKTSKEETDLENSTNEELRDEKHEKTSESITSGKSNTEKKETEMFSEENEEEENDWLYTMQDDKDVSDENESEETIENSGTPDTIEQEDNVEVKEIKKDISSIVEMKHTEPKSEKKVYIVVLVGIIGILCLLLLFIKKRNEKGR